MIAIGRKQKYLYIYIGVIDDKMNVKYNSDFITLRDSISNQMTLNMPITDIEKETSPVSKVSTMLVVLIFLGAVGVPVSVVVGQTVMEGSFPLNATPVTIGSGSNILTDGSMGNILYFELFHSGNFPSSTELASILAHAFEVAGLGFLGVYVYTFAFYITAVFLAGFEITTTTILGALEAAASALGLVLSPEVLVPVATAVVGA